MISSISSQSKAWSTFHWGSWTRSQNGAGEVGSPVLQKKTRHQNLQVCPQCSLTIRSLADFTRHLATEHRFHCPQCSLKFTTRRGLEEHSLKVYLYPYPCSVQSKQTNNLPLFEGAWNGVHSVRTASLLRHLRAQLWAAGSLGGKTPELTLDKALGYESIGVT